MVRVADMPAIGRGFIEELEMPVFDQQSWVETVAPEDRRVSTAAVSRRGEKPFS